MFHIEIENCCSGTFKGQSVILTVSIWQCKIVLSSNTGLSYTVQGRNMVYPGPIDPCFLAVILIPEPHFPQNFDP